MAVKEFTIIIGNEIYFPKINVKIDKGGGRFLYCASLYILEDEETKQLCKIDNYHEKGNHIHYYKKDGNEGRQESFNFESIGKTIDFLILNWKKIMEERKNE